MAGRLEGKVAVITGAGSGIGAASAELFCRQGAKVIAVDISGQQEDVARRIGASCLPFHADVSKGSDVQAMLAKAVSAFGRLDILYNNASIIGEMNLVGDYTEEGYDQIMAINGRSAFLGMRYAIPIMLKQGGGGSIVNSCSMASVVAFKAQVGYCGAKGAVLMMTKVAAVEYADKGIRVNAILPGPIKTGMTAGMDQAALDVVYRATPMGRMAESSEVADLALFLASDESSFITGSSILIDGGYTSL